MSPAAVDRRETSRWLLFAMACAALCSVGPGSSAAAAVNDTGADVAAAAAAAGTAEPRRVAWPCAPADSAGACLFKGLLQNALRLFAAANRRQDAAPATAALQTQSKGIEEYLLEQIQNLFGMFSFGFDLPAEVTAPWTLLKSSLFARGKKNKNLGPMLAAGFAVMAGTLVPLAFGALFMLAGKALMTSLLAITLSGLLGLKALFGKHEAGGHLKAYAAAPVAAPHYVTAAEALQYEQELATYRTGQTEAKMHSAAGNYYAGGESNLSGYYRGSAEQLAQDGTSGQPEYLRPAGTAAAPVAAHHHLKFSGAVADHKQNDGGKVANNS